MNFKENPFYILKVNIYDDKETILKKSDEAVFEVEDDLIQRAVKELTTPKRRLFWELRWILCVASNNMEELYNIIKREKAVNIYSDKNSSLCLMSQGSEYHLNRTEKIVNYPVSEKLTIVNTFTFYIEHHDDVSNLRNTLFQYDGPGDPYHLSKVSDLAKSLHRIAGALSDITVQDVEKLINECRQYAMFPNASKEDILDAFNEYIQEIEVTLSNALAKQQNDSDFLKDVFNLKDFDYMKYGDLARLFSTYKENATALLFKSLENIFNVLQSGLSSSTYNEKFSKTLLEEFPKFMDLAEWIVTISPEENKIVEGAILKIRQYAIKIANEYNKYESSKDILYMLRKRCPSEFDKTKNQLNEDCSAIDELTANLMRMIQDRMNNYSYSNKAKSEDNKNPSKGKVVVFGLIIIFILFLFEKC